MRFLQSVLIAFLFTVIAQNSLFVAYASTNKSPALSPSINHQNNSKRGQWAQKISNHTPRHESNLIVADGTVYLIGGRGIKAVQSYDVTNNRWDAVIDKTDIEIHHFQAVNLKQAGQEKVYIVGAFTGGWPNETGISDVLAFDPKANTLKSVAPIPQSRQRGAAAAVTYNERIYFVGGSTLGHMSGTTTLFDEFDPATNTFRRLPNAPIARDHAQAAVVGDKLYVLSGRKTSRATGDDFNLTTHEVDMYDFASSKWTTLPETANIPNPRAGANVVVVGKYILVLGGESAAQVPAHAHVEAFNTQSQTWVSLPPLVRGRHSGGAVYHGGKIIAVTGSGKRGGSPELDSLEIIAIDESIIDAYAKQNRVEANIADNSGTALQTLSMNLLGPDTQETAPNNPFMNYLNLTHITDANGITRTYRGYYAADGKAQYSSADSGNIWRTHFTPSNSGLYHYESYLYSGDKAALSKTNNPSLDIVAAQKGTIDISAATVAQKPFEKTGFLDIKDGFFYATRTQQYWLKAGANSPENLLGYWEIDGTYRHSDQQREGESNTGEGLHKFEAHIKDFSQDDLLWGQDKNKGKGLIGAINYLAEQGMNAQYFLTMNIDGDGRDVWPYINHNTLDRFDVSKLAQWNMIFEHMQNQGILLHIVTQETENELMLDQGNTGDLRQLYYHELIARFAHHKALVWNVGEENGPASWSPNGQNDQQRIDMAAFLAKNDPYQHPVLIHSHAHASAKDEILTPLITSEYDGISFQVDERTHVFEEIAKWRRLSSVNRAPWLITMDEIGKWHVGARVDKDDPTHDSLRQHVLWPTFLAGGAGVEWYAGAHQPQNDLGLKDFRTRENLWRLTDIAKRFLEKHVRLHEMRTLPLEKDIEFVQKEYENQKHFTKTVKAASQYKSQSESQFIAYLIEPEVVTGSLPNGTYQQIWLDPISGIETVKDDVVINSESFSIAFSAKESEQDWVVLLSAR